MATTRLIIQGDDFGMCHAINLGIAEAFRAGMVTQASAMAPCPWIAEAAALAIELEIPVGAHGTLTCEWDYLRWRPLTPGQSLSEPDGTMHRTFDGAAAILDKQEAADELSAQIEVLRGCGMPPSYIDCHMGPTSRAGFSEACKRAGLPFLYPVIDECLTLDSIAMLSPMPADEKKPWLLNRLEEFSPGVHLIVTHPAVDDQELRSIARPESENYCWAEENRTSDLRVLLDPEVGSRIEALGIELVSVADL